MGDGRHAAGERVGDVVLVAAQRVGKGRVVAFGDTSPFQNVAIFLSRSLVEDTVTWLTGGESSFWGISNTQAASRDYDKAIIDFSLRPDARLALFTSASLGGLANSLTRAGVSAVPALSSDEWSASVGYLWMVGPTRNPTPGESSWLLDYVEEGGNLVICQGYRSPGHSQDLLSAFGFSVEPVPLGGGDADSPVRHKEAWWVTYGGEADTTILASAHGYPTGIMARPGHGTVTVIGDGRVFLDENLESEFKGTPENVKFVLDLVEEMRDRRRHAIASGR
jgi:hypothetical protein